jgi:GT2 family glycosyltransferase
MNAPLSRVICSICVANFNGEALLDACLSSILSQELNGDIEIIVHDDASTDNSLKVLARYADVRVLKSTENVGFCKSNNRMVAEARGEFILLLNNDAALEPGALSALLEKAQALDAPAILTLPQRDWDTDLLVDRGCLLDPFMNPVPNLRKNRTEVAMVIGACLWMPRSLWNRIGGFPDWIESIAEDMFICCAARQLGYAVFCLPTSSYRHMQGKSFGGNKVNAGRLTTTYRRRRLSERNKSSLLTIFTPSPWLIPVLALHIATLTTEGLLLTAVRRDIRIWKDIYLASLSYLWQQRAELRKLRHELQSARTITAATYYSAFTWWPRKLIMLARYGLPKLR